MTHVDRTDNPNETKWQPASDGDDRVSSVTGERPTLTELRQSVGEITRILYVRRWLFFVPICFVMTGAFIMSLRVPRQYQATTTFERRDDPVLVNLPRNEGSGAFITFRRTLEKDVTNLDAITGIVRRFDLVHANDADRTDSENAPPPPDEAAVKRIARRIASGLQVRILQESEHLDVIQIQYTTDRPESLTEVLDHVRDTYIADTQKRITDLLRRTRDWFETERRKRRTLVTTLEDDLIQYRTEHRGLDPLDPNSSMAKLRQLREDLLELERKGKELQTQIDGRKRFVQGGADAAPELVPANLAAELGIMTTPPDPAARQRAEALRRITLQIEDLKTVRGMTDRHPDIIALVRKRDNIAAALDEQYAAQRAGLSVNGVTDIAATVGPAPLDDDPLLADRARAEMETQIFEQLLADNQSERETLRATIEEYEVLQRDAFVHRKEFGARVEEVERARRELELYQGYADQVGRVLAAENSQRGILFQRIVPARGSDRPVSPRVSTVIVLTLTIGITAGIILVLVSEIFDRTVRTRRQVTSGLGLPILESIGEIVASAARRRRMFTQVCVVPVIVLTLVSMVGLSGTMAYLSLTHRDLYERAVTLPRSALQRFVARSSAWPPLAEALTPSEEQQR